MAYEGIVPMMLINIYIEDFNSCAVSPKWARIGSLSTGDSFRLKKVREQFRIFNRSSSVVFNTVALFFIS